MTLHRSGAIAALLLFCLGAAIPSLGADDYQEASRLFKEGKRAEALERVDAFLAQHARDARARFLKGVILTEQNRTQEAIKVFTDLTQDYPELPEPYNNLAVLYAGQGDYEKARRSLEMAIRTHPSYAVAHENLGDIYATLASQAYDKALQLDSSNTTARKKLALIKELVPAKAATALAKAEPEKPAPAVEAKSAVSAPKPSDERPPAQVQPGQKPSSNKPTPQVDQTAAVAKIVESWAKAWSSNDAAGYLSFYAPTFQPPGGQSRQDWEADRRARLAKPKKIHVTVSSIRVKFTDNTHAVATFRQNYSSDTLKASGNKTMRLMRSGDRWLIEQELIEK
jgi:uncharacterized protein (TIGR02246 family)